MHSRSKPARQQAYWCARRMEERFDVEVVDVNIINMKPKKTAPKPSGQR